ncbi:MAG: DUF1819 family protein [Atopobiaceae bacterium]|nr:DUF1819 family protein [Atopobiaceae bacterium]
MARLEGACITREQFLLREMRIACQLHMDGLSDEEVIAQITGQNLIQYPTERMVNNIARVCVKRINAVDSERIVQIIATGTPEAAAQANLYAMMCTYPLVRDFMVSEVGRRYAEYDYTLGQMEMNAYMTRLQAEYENIAKVSDGTVGKIKQVLRKGLVECGMLASARSEELTPIFLDFDVREAIENKNDVAALVAFGVREAI